MIAPLTKQPTKKITGVVAGPAKSRAEAVLLALSDPTTEPIPQAPGKGATGAWPGN